MQETETNVFEGLQRDALVLFPQAHFCLILAVALGIWWLEAHFAEEIREAWQCD